MSTSKQKESSIVIDKYRDVYRRLHNKDCKIYICAGGYYQINDSNKYRLSDIRKMTESLELRIDTTEQKTTD